MIKFNQLAEKDEEKKKLKIFFSSIKTKVAIKFPNLFIYFILFIFFFFLLKIGLVLEGLDLCVDCMKTLYLPKILIHFLFSQVRRQEILCCNFLDTLGANNSFLNIGSLQARGPEDLLSIAKSSLYR